MCRSVPQMPVFCTRMSTSLIPQVGSGASCRVRPRAEAALTRAFMSHVCTIAMSIYKTDIPVYRMRRIDSAEYAWCREVAPLRDHPRGLHHRTLQRTAGHDGVRSNAHHEVPLYPTCGRSLWGGPTDTAE